MRILLSTLLIALSGLVFSQKELTNQDIWYGPTFQMDYVSGLRSMSDGLNYTRLEVVTWILGLFQQFSRLQLPYALQVAQI